MVGGRSGGGDCTGRGEVGGGSLLSALAKAGKHDRRQGNEQTREGQGQRRQSTGSVGEGLREERGGEEGLFKWLIP